MKIYFASDHAGFEMKNSLIEFVKELGFEAEDCGAYELNPNDDYPEFVKKAAQAVSEATDGSRGIVLGGSGQGEAMCANKFKGVRAVEYYAPSRGAVNIIEDSRSHNDSNVLSLGARFLSLDEAKEAVRLWLTTEFSGEERHVRRINEIG
jgi:ribose 5-phosphate isomerase B